MNKKLLVTSALMAFVSSCMLAQVKKPFVGTQTVTAEQIEQLQEVVISDTKFAQSKEKSGKVITKITQEEIQKKAGQTLAMILNSVAGVEINGSQSANGKNLGYYIRGGKNQQVLILIDGNPVTDASGISIEYDLRLLPIDQVESIEIMKGAASTLYGTGAATAVINITLKKSVNQPIAANVYMNIGSNNTSDNHKYNGQDFNQGLSVSGKVDKISYLASMNSTETSGMSQIASPDESLKYENDRFSRLNFMSKIGVEVSKKVQLDFFGNYDKIINAYDYNFDNTGFDDTNKNESTTKQFRFGFSPKFKYAKGSFVLNSSFTKINRKYDELNSWTNTIDVTTYESRNVNVDAFNKYNFNKNLFLITGVNYQFFDMLTESPYGTIENANSKFNIVDPYITGVYTSDFGLNVNAGARLNVHSAYGNQVVYNVNPSFLLNKNFKVLASISTAFVTPSLYQLYSPYGNTTLTPENNGTLEGGFDITLFDKKLNFNAVSFYREQNNSIGFDATYHYANVEGIHKAKGVETSLNYAFSKKINANANYTFTEVDEALLRLIPKHKANISLDYAASERLFLNANYQYVDGRMDAFFDGNTYANVQTKLGSYNLVNFTSRYELIKNTMTAFGTVTNIFNENYVENIGYSTRGRNFKLGLNLKF